MSDITEVPEKSVVRESGTKRVKKERYRENAEVLLVLVPSFFFSGVGGPRVTRRREPHVYAQCVVSPLSRPPG